MLRKLRQMAQIQTRVLQKGERGSALQSGVTAGHRPALHLLVFSKAHVHQLCFSPVIPAIKPTPPSPSQMCGTWCVWKMEASEGPLLFLHVSGAQLCMQNELAGLTEVHCASNGFSVNCHA